MLDLLDTVISWLGSAYVELIILTLLLVAFFTQRRDHRLVATGIRLVRAVIVVMISLYFMFIWASTVQPTLRAISIFGMFVVNLYFLYNLVLVRFERPYRAALSTLAQQPGKLVNVQAVWQTGKRFYHLRYLLSSLISGTNPLRFLREIAIDRVRDDIKDELRRFGVEQKLITMQVLINYLKNQLVCDETLPKDFQDVMIREIDNFGKHPWVQEQVNEFLRVATETPEDLQFPQWLEHFDVCVGSQ